MCIATGHNASKAEEIFNAVQEKFRADSIPWANAVSLSVDNTNSIIGKNNSFASWCRQRNPDIFVSGCPCHLVHIAARNGHDSFVNIEDLHIDLYYWFERSTKRKGVLLEYMELCGHEYAKILKHVSTRWLSLERCVQRTLEKYSGLKSYQRFSRLRDAFTNPPTEVALLFHHASIPLFNNFDKLLQSEEPIIHMFHDSTIQLARSLANRIITPQVLKDTPVTELNMDDPQFYKPEHSIFMGVTTKFKLQKLLNDGDISERQHSRVFKAAQAYFKDSLSYILTKFPLSNELIMKAGWIDVGSRIDSKWESVEFFINRLKAIFQQLPVDKLYDEFCDYQTLPDECFRDDVLKEAKVIDGEEDGEVLFYYRVDVLWWHIAQLVIPGTTAKRFKHLPKVAGLVLVLPHSNAGEERLFSIVRKNKTESRALMKLEGTLSSLLAMKLQYPEQTVPCHMWSPTKELLDSSKKAATAYNTEH